MRTIFGRFFAGLLAALLLAVMPAQAETDTVRIGFQPGLTYLPFVVLQHEQMIEKAAAASGAPGLKVSWSRHTGGFAMNDALMSDNLDIAATGIPSFLILWAKTRGRMATRGLAGYGYIPVGLITRDPDVKTIADFSDKDRIALPGVKTSVQAIYIAMAAEKAFGPGQSTRLDPITVTRAHPDALAALLGNTEINSMFTIPPYLNIALKRPDVHLVTTAIDIVGSPVSNGVVYLQDRFVQANPKVVAAVYEGLKQSLAMINADPRRAAEIYLQVSGEKTPLEEIQGMITAPGTVYDIAPHGTVPLARFLKRTGVIAAEPTDWKELFLPYVHAEPGS
jgi:NitT/TauT family transport system substrate-binding protein